MAVNNRALLALLEEATASPAELARVLTGDDVWKRLSDGLAYYSQPPPMSSMDGGVGAGAELEDGLVDRAVAKDCATLLGVGEAQAAALVRATLRDEPGLTAAVADGSADLHSVDVLLLVRAHYYAERLALLDSLKELVRIALDDSHLYGSVVAACMEYGPQDVEGESGSVAADGGAGGGIGGLLCPEGEGKAPRLVEATLSFLSSRTADGGKGLPSLRQLGAEDFDLFKGGSGGGGGGSGGDSETAALAAAVAMAEADSASSARTLLARHQLQSARQDAAEMSSATELLLLLHYQLCEASVPRLARVAAALGPALSLPPALEELNARFENTGGSAARGNGSSSAAGQRFSSLCALLLCESLQLQKLTALAMYAERAPAAAETAANAAAGSALASGASHSAARGAANAARAAAAADRTRALKLWRNHPLLRCFYSGGGEGEGEGERGDDRAELSRVFFSLLSASQRSATSAAPVAPVLLAWASWLKLARAALTRDDGDGEEGAGSALEAFDAVFTSPPSPSPSPSLTGAEAAAAAAVSVATGGGGLASCGAIMASLGLAASSGAVDPATAAAAARAVVVGLDGDGENSIGAMGGDETEDEGAIAASLALQSALDCIAALRPLDRAAAAAVAAASSTAAAAAAVPLLEGGGGGGGMTSSSSSSSSAVTRGSEAAAAAASAFAATARECAPSPSPVALSPAVSSCCKGVFRELLSSFAAAFPGIRRPDLARRGCEFDVATNRVAAVVAQGKAGELLRPSHGKGYDFDDEDDDDDDVYSYAEDEENEGGSGRDENDDGMGAYESKRGNGSRSRNRNRNGNPFAFADFDDCVFGECAPGGSGGAVSGSSPSHTRARTRTCTSTRADLPSVSFATSL